MGILSSACFSEKCLFQLHYACYQQEVLLICSHRREKIHRGGKWHTVMFNFVDILRYCSTFATFDVIVILLKSVAQKCLRLQWTSGSLLTGVSILAVENNAGSNPLESRFSLLSLYYPTQTGLPGWRIKYILAKGHRERRSGGPRYESAIPRLLPCWVTSFSASAFPSLNWE